MDLELQAHQRIEDDTDEELTDAMWEEAERSLRLKQGRKTGGLVLPKLDPGHLADISLTTDSKTGISKVDASKLLPREQRALADRSIKKIEDPVQMKKDKLIEKQATAGSDWYNLPKTDLTPELRRDLQLLKMRSVLDPHKHYKKDNSRPDVPAFSQVGTVIEGATEFYNGRINNKDRKETFLDEVLSQEQSNGRFKRKYQEVITAKGSGKKAHYQAVKAKRKGRVEKR